MKTRNRINPFSEKRVRTFNSLDTNPDDWTHANIKSFKPIHGQRDSGNPFTHWVPVYKIPEGYTNPFGKDPEQYEHKRCQLCDTEIVSNGIILNEKTKQFLIVGGECYLVYEHDDTRHMKLQLMKFGTSKVRSRLRLSGCQKA